MILPQPGDFMTTPSADNQTAYQQDGVQYLHKIIQLFGGYKKRGLGFLQLAPGQHVLDVGCGTGEDAAAIAGIVGPTGRVAGVDNSETMLTAARTLATKTGLPLTFDLAEAHALPHDDHTFDRTRSDRVFQHLHRPTEALAEMVRVTKPGGWVSVLDVDWASVLIDSATPALTRTILAYHYQHHVNGSAGTQLYRLFKETKLTDVEAYAETVCVTEWPIAAMIWGLDAITRKAVAEGIVPAADMARWISDLDERSRAGKFFSSITGFVVRGRKP